MATLKLEDYTFSGLEDKESKPPAAPRLNPTLTIPEVETILPEPPVLPTPEPQEEEEEFNFSELLQVKKPGREKAVSSGYGTRKDPFRKGTAFHDGIDIPLDSNTPLKPFGKGEVFFAGNRKGYGNSVGIDYGNGIQIYLNHLNRTEVEVGDKVTADAIIGLSGNTGRSTAPHVHVQALKDGVSIDPRKVFNENPDEVGLALTIRGLLEDNNIIAESSEENFNFSGMGEEEAPSQDTLNFSEVLPTTENGQEDTDVLKFAPAEKQDEVGYFKLFKEGFAPHLDKMAKGIASIEQFRPKKRIKNPNAPGRPISFSLAGTDNQPPSLEAVNKELARILNLSGLNEKFKNDKDFKTGKAGTPLVFVSNPDIRENPDGTWQVIIPYGMPSGAVELVNAYARGGAKAFSEKRKELEEQAKIYKEDIDKQKQTFERVQAFKKEHPYINFLTDPGRPIIRGVADTALSELQLMHSMSMLPRALWISTVHGIDSDEYLELMKEDAVVQIEINKALEAAPKEDILPAKLLRAGTSAVGMLPRFATIGRAGGWALPTLTYVENLHRGNREAFQAALPMAVMVGSMRGLEKFINAGGNPLDLFNKSEIANRDIVTSIKANSPGNFNYHLMANLEPMGIPIRSIDFKAINPFQRQLVLRGVNALTNVGTTLATNIQTDIDTLAEQAFIGLILPTGKGVRQRTTGFQRRSIIHGDAYTLPDGSVLLKAPIDEASGIIGGRIPRVAPRTTPSIFEERATTPRPLGTIVEGIRNDGRPFDVAYEVPPARQLGESKIRFLDTQGLKSARSIVLPIDQAALNLIDLRRAYETGSYLRGIPAQTTGKIGKFNVISDQRKQDLLSAIKILDEAIPKETQEYFAKNEEVIREAIKTNYEDRIKKEEFVLGKKIIRKPGSQLTLDDVRPYNPVPKTPTTGKSTLDNFIQNTRRTMVSVEESGKRGLEANKKNKGTLDMGLDPSDVPYLVQIAIGKLGRKGLDAAEFIREMAAEHGEDFFKYGMEVYKQARSFIDGVNNLADAMTSDFGVKYNALDKGKFKTPPFPIADLAAIKNIYYIGSKYLKEAKEQDIPLDKVIATQKGLRTDRLIKFGEDPYIAITEGKTDPAGNVEVPKAVKVGDEYYLFDGHHRSSAAKISGKLTIKARVIDFNNPSQYQTRQERAREAFGDVGKDNKIFTQERQLEIQENFLDIPKGQQEGFTGSTKWTVEQIGKIAKTAGFYIEDAYRRGIVPTARDLKIALGEAYERMNDEDFADIYAESMRKFKEELNEFAVMMKITDASGKTKVAVGIDPSLIGTLAKNLYSGDLGTIIAKELLQNAADAIKAKNYTGKTTKEKDTTRFIPSKEWTYEEVNQLWMNTYGGSLEKGLGFIKDAYSLLGYDEDIVKVIDTAYKLAEKSSNANENSPRDKAYRKAAIDEAIEAIDPNGKLKTIKGNIIPLKASVELDINTHDKTINIVDNGIGMSPEVMTKEFADLGGTLKQAQESSGGYGIAKAAMFFNAENIEVTSIWENPKTGKILKTKLSGSADDWLNPEQGLSFETKEIEKGKTGTRVVLKLKSKNADGGEVNFEEYYVNKFLATFHAIHKLPTDLSINVNGKDIQQTSYYKADNTEKVQTIKTTGVDMDIYVSPEMEQKSNLDIELLNHGLPQGNISIYVGDAGKLPDRIVVDVKAKGFPKDDNYPWKPDRQDLRADARSALEDYFKNHLVADAARKERELLISTIRDAVDINGTTLEPVVKVPKVNELDVTDIEGILKQLGMSLDDFGKLPKSQQKSVYELAHQDIKVSEAAKKPDIPKTHKVVDTNGSIDKALVKEIGADPLISKLSNILDKVTTNFLNALAPYSNKYLDGAYYGIGLGKKYFAVNIKGEAVFGKDVKDIILYNPYNSIDAIENLIEAGKIAEEDGPRELARHLTASGVHEATHQVQRNHYEGFSSELTENMGRSLDAQVEAQRLLAEFLGANNREAYNAIKRQAEKVRVAIRSGENIFSKVSDASTGRELQHLSGSKFAEKYEQSGELKSSEGVRGRTNSTPPRLEEVTRYNKPIHATTTLENATTKQITNRNISRDIFDSAKSEIINSIQDIIDNEGGTGTVLNSGLNPDAFLNQIGLLYKGWQDFEAFSKSLINKYGEKISPHLEAIWNWMKESALRFHQDERGVFNFGKQKRLYTGKELTTFNDNRSSKFRNFSIKAHRGIALAQTYEPFGFVYETLRGLQRTTNAYSTTILEQLSRAVTLLKKDTDQKVAQAIFTRNKEGINNSAEDAAIIARFGLTPEQTFAYHYIRSAVSNVLDLRRDQILYREHQNIAHINEQLTNLGLPTGGTPINAQHGELLTKLVDAYDKVKAVEDYYQELKDSGYISLQRLGRYRAELENPNVPATIVKNGRTLRNPERFLVDYADSPELAQQRINEWREQLKLTNKGRILDAKNPADFKEISRKLTPGEFEELVSGAGVRNTPEVDALRAEVYEKYPTMGYQLKRELYPGYRENSEFVIKSIAHQAEVYASSYYNNLGRQEGLRALEATGIETSDKDLWNVARQFIEDETSTPQYNNVDKAAFKARKFTYLMQLGYQVKQLYLNAFVQPVTQNYNYLARVENPTTGKRLGGLIEIERVFTKGAKLSLQLAKAAAEDRIGRKTIRSPEFIEFRDIYNQLKNERVIEPEYTKSLLELEAEEASGIDSKFQSKTRNFFSWKQQEHWAGGFMRAGEVTTRTQMAASLFIAGKKFGLSGKPLTDFMVRGIDATQTNPSRGENPYYVRRAGELGKLFYQFGAFRHMWWENLVLNAKSDWKHKSPAATARTLAPLAIMSGISGLPLTGFAFTLYGLATGNNPNEDLRRWVKNKIADNDYLEALALYGFTGSAGFSQATGIQAPVVDTLADQLTQDSWWDKIFGSNVPALMTMKQIGQGLSGAAAAAYDGDVSKIVAGIAQAAPVPGNRPLRDIVKANEAYYEGYNTKAGEDIINRSQVSPFDIGGQIFGITPNEVSEFYTERKYKKLKTSGFGKASRRAYRKLRRTF